jgi:hypothetical protein
MANLGDLKQRIISETLRDDLADTLASQFQGLIARSIDQYESEGWWFNEKRLVTQCVPMQEFVLWPTGTPAEAIRLDGLYLEQNSGNSRWPITPRSVAEFEALAQPSTTGQPTDYLVANDRIRLFPIPNQAYQLAWDLIVAVTPVLVADTDANFWTNQGQDLIVAQVKIRLYRDFLSATITDPRLVNAMAAERDYYSNLRSDSSRRVATGRLQPGW